MFRRKMRVSLLKLDNIEKWRSCFPRNSGKSKLSIGRDGDDYTDGRLGCDGKENSPLSWVL